MKTPHHRQGRCKCGRYTGATVCECRLDQVLREMRGEQMRLVLAMVVSDNRGMAGEGI
jgi:hypothetical protein